MPLYFGLSFTSLSIRNHSKNNLLFMIWIVLKHKKQEIFFFFSMQTLRAIVTLFFLNFFQSSFFDREFIPSQSYSFIKSLIFVILCRYLLISSWFSVTFTAYWKHLLSYLLIGFIVAFLFFIQSRESIYDPTQFRFILWNL